MNHPAVSKLASRLRELAHRFQFAHFSDDEDEALDVATQLSALASEIEKEAGGRLIAPGVHGPKSAPLPITDEEAREYEACMASTGQPPAPSVDDPVNHPSHYTSGEIECINAIRAALTPEEFRGFCKGNVLKYVWRERLKGGDESLAKAGWYLAKIGGGA